MGAMRAQLLGGGKPPDDEENDEYYKELAAIAAQIDPKQFSLVMQLISRDVWVEGKLCYVGDCVMKALKIQISKPRTMFLKKTCAQL